MQLTLPDWVEHPIIDDKKRKRQTIFSIHVHPDGSRLATGGLDQKVRIWATEPIIDSQLDAKKDVQRLLSVMTRHSGSVLAVRWSASGRYLASGSDDTICLIWELDPTGLGGRSFGSFGSREEEHSVEAWRTHRRLAAHESDVVDLAWSPDTEDSYLATVGLDSRVIVWAGPRDGPGGFERLRVITGHQGFVKGIVWDPIGQYLATASDDKTMKFWQVGGDWALLKTVSKPFENSRHTFFRRPSWSPDGAHIVSANASSGSVFVANIISREDWSCETNLVGHENAVAVTAFSPRLIRQSNEVGEAENTTMMALGSLDQSISIWLSGHRRPICVARDLFQLQIMDMSWSADGLTLYACSADGYIAAFSFVDDDFSFASDRELTQARELLGYSEHQRRLLQSKGNRAYANGSLSSQHGTQERPTMLVARKAGMPRPAQVHIGSSQSSANTLPTARLDQHITLTRDGKRRIRPTLISSDDTYGGGEIGTLSIHATLSSSTDSVAPGSTPYVRGAKRTNSMTYDDDDRQSMLAPSGKRAKDIGRTLGSEVQRGQAGPSVPIRSRAGGLGAAASHDFARAGSVLTTPATLSVYRKEGTSGTIEIRNFDGNRPSEIYCFDSDAARCTWMDFYDAGALLATVSESFAAVGFEDGSLAVYTSKGRRTGLMRVEAPCHRLESCREFLVAITTDGQMRRWNVKADKEIGRPLSVLPLFESKAGALEQDEILHFWVHSNGLPVVIMRSEHAYTLDPAKMAWTMISSGWFVDCSPVWEGRTRGRGASMDSLASGGQSNVRRDPVRAVESTMNDLVVIHRSTTGIRAAEKPPSDRLDEFNVAVTLRHLEARLTAATLLESATEYRAHLQTYARKLGDEGIRNQAEDLCRSLLGPVYYNPPTAATEVKANWCPLVCGLQKRDLLAEVLRIMARGRLLLGFVDTYQKLLKDVQQQEW